MTANIKLSKLGEGRSHTVVVTEDGHSLAFGWNKHGQLGSGSAKNEIESSPVRCLVSEVSYATCGGDFTVWLSSVEGSSILTAGLPQYGQLGHGTDNEYNSKDSSVRLVYEAQPCPRAVAKLSGETIVKVACGTNHTVLLVVWVIPWSLLMEQMLVNGFASLIYTMGKLLVKPHRDIKTMFSNAMKAYRMIAGIKVGLSREPAWIYPICPRQPGDTECGYYVMLYMYSIIQS
ncbi:hypothetical protein K1719_014729 [Acacia pycnantha]|nr:hypothetical protein K1719_014729 [Acacia pycnantha]